MGRVAYLAIIAAIFLLGGYFAVLDVRTIAQGNLPSATAFYEAVVCLVSAVALVLDFKKTGEENVVN